MASEHDQSSFVEALPSRPSLEMQRKRAKNLLRAASSGDADALRRIGALHPKPPAGDSLTSAHRIAQVCQGNGVPFSRP